jgi:hypothetical protein
MSWLPVPDSVEDCVLPVALLLLSVTVREALKVPPALGVKVTAIGQLLLAARVPPHVVV